MRDGLLGQPQYGRVARRGVEHAFEIAPQFQTPRAALVFVFLALSAQRDVVVAGVEVAAAFEERAPLARDVRKVVAFAVAPGDPFGHFGGVVGRGHPVAARRVEPEHLSAVPGRHHGRNGLGGDRDGAAARGVPQQRLRERRGDQVVGAGTFAACGQFDGPVGGVIHPARADHAVGRGHGPRGERGQRDGRSGLQIVVAAVGIDRAALREAAETAFAEVFGVAVEVFAAHRADDDLDDPPGLCRGALKRPESGYGI